MTHSRPTVNLPRERISIIRSKAFISTLLGASLFVLPVVLIAQSPKRLKEDVIAIQKKYDTLWEPGKETYVFVGSSSIRFWENLPELFPELQVVNSGFGGSMASDLLVYLEELVLAYEPSKVFTYVGDNDIFEKKGPSKVIRQTRRIIRRIQKMNGPTPVLVIGVKPSPVRWHLKKKYEKLNRKLRTYCAENTLVDYMHVWDAMLDEEGIRQEIFLEDGLHMNEKGYAIWERILEPLGKK